MPQDVFQEAVQAIEEGNRPRARELLAGLLKEKPRNASYWIWMSAAVDTRKEQIYCLQTARSLDPASELAKRGVVLLGVLPPDQGIKPFSLNRPRTWEQRVLANYGMTGQSG